MSISRFILMEGFVDKLVDLVCGNMNEKECFSFLNDINSIEYEFRYTSLNFSNYLNHMRDLLRTQIIKTLDILILDGKPIWDGYMFSQFKNGYTFNIKNVHYKNDFSKVKFIDKYTETNKSIPRISHKDMSRLAYPTDNYVLVQD